MENIGYFCIVKHSKTVIKTIFVLLAVCWTALPTHANNEFNIEYYDSVEVSLLTCQPHDEVYSLYGHTAIRWNDTTQKAKTWHSITAYSTSGNRTLRCALSSD